MGNKGKARVNYLGSAGLVQSETAPGWKDIYRVSTVKDSKWNLGDRVVMPDGRVFRYAKSSGLCKTSMACSFDDDKAQGYDGVVVGGIAGVDKLTIDGGTHDEFTKDELRGGYIIIYESAVTGDEQFRGIIGNDAADANADFTVYLDAPLTVEVTTSMSAEVFYNPYARLTGVASSGASKAGVPASYVSGTGKYFWIQTWGPIWIAPQNAGFQAATKQRQAVFSNDGSLKAEGDVDAYDITQTAGFLITRNFTAGPLFMLQISP